MSELDARRLRQMACEHPYYHAYVSFSTIDPKPKCRFVCGECGLDVTNGLPERPEVPTEERLSKGEALRHALDMTELDSIPTQRGGEG